VLAVVRHLGADRAVHRFEIRTAVHNRRSRAVAERCGFELEGVLHGALRVGAERHDVAVYGRTA
jgi:ribosomal-protein-serine acetyltransferase